MMNDTTNNDQKPVEWKLGDSTTFTEHPGYNIEFSMSAEEIEAHNKAWVEKCLKVFAECTSMILIQSPDGTHKILK